jgi:hypothetical protein
MDGTAEPGAVSQYCDQGIEVARCGTASAPQEISLAIGSYGQTQGLKGTDW